VNWVKFDKDRPETWPKTSDDVLVEFRGTGWCKAFFNRGLFRNAGNGAVMEQAAITHYAEITYPTDTQSTVSVPRKLSEEDWEWFDDVAFKCDLGPSELWCEIVKHFEA